MLTAPGAATRPELAALVQQLFCLLQSVAAPPTPNPSGRCCPKAKPTLAANPCLAGNRLTPPPQDLAPPSAACLDRPNGSRYQPLPGEKQSLPPPTSQAEADALLKGQEPPADSYLPLIRLGQLPTAAVWNVATFQISIQQVSPTSGGASGGSGNQNYSLRGDFALLDNLLLSAYLTDADDPLYKAPASKPSNPGNRWVVYGTALKGRLAVGKAWQWAAEGAIELFNVCSGASGADSCTSADPSNTSNYSNIFNDSSTPVFNRNLVGSIALPLSWQANQKLQLSFVPAVTWLPASQGAGQGGAGQFFGTNISLGVGANYRPTPQLQLFGSAMVPLGPGYNGFDSNLVYSRTPILSVGTNFAVNPRIGLEASITNGFGLSPGTAILALPSAPWQPMLSGRFTWTPSAPDSKSPNYTARQASLALGGIGVNTALTPANGIEPQNNFISTLIGKSGYNFRLGGKIMMMRPTKQLPIWGGLHIGFGRNYQPNTRTQGYLFLETMHTWEATPWLAFNVNPKLANSGLGTPWGVGISANIQLGKSFQLIPEVNAVATNFGGTNDTNGSLALRWLAGAKTTLDLYVSNADGLLDMGQLLSGNQIRIGTKLTLSF